MPSTTYLITGANRGIGLGLVTSLLLRSNTTVIAGVRDPTHPTSQALSTLPTAQGSHVVLVKIDATSQTDAQDAFTTLRESHSIHTIDTVIANAGIGKYYGTALNTPASEFRDHYEVNVIGSMLLFQATWPLLSKSAAPKFIAISSAVASIGTMAKHPAVVSAYGASKVALNYLVNKIHYENENIVAVTVNPGWIATDMGVDAAKQMNIPRDQLTLSLEESLRGILKIIDNATREETSATFQSYDGSIIPW